jgi:hypothetical protein
VSRTAPALTTHVTPTLCTCGRSVGASVFGGGAVVKVIPQPRRPFLTTVSFGGLVGTAVCPLFPKGALDDEAQRSLRQLCPEGAENKVAQGKATRAPRALAPPWV